MKEEHPERLWTKDFILITLSNLLLFTTVQMQATTLPAYVKETYHSNDFVASLVIMLFNICAIVSRMYTGEAIKTKRSKVLAFLGLMIAGLAMIGYFFSATITLLIALRAVFGVGFGLGSTTFATLASNSIPPRRIGEGMGYFGLSVSLALALGPIVGITLLNEYGFTIMVIAAVGMVAIALPLLFSTRSQPVPVLQNPELQAKGLGRFFDRKILLPTVLNTLLAITYGGLMSFLVLFGKEANLANVSWYFFCNAITILLVRPLSGKLFDRKGPIAVLPLGALLSGTGLMILSFTDNNYLLFTSAAFYGLGYGFIQPAIQAWMVKVVSPEQRGMANAVFLSTIDLGIGIGSLLLGIIITYSSYSIMYRWSAIFMLLFLVIYFVSYFKAKASKEQQLAA
ncbi:MFS transporter [Brevibacillus invocatus]|uniref:MFS transporter n=1 Tax=Brevibacillus invocatus TaxID=173959 RepID=A0A3M8CEI0_9BACL|nr:MFS transporter [Brevibacillus invocatus]RNB74166.1 MFS transporter [Brevibacillus invocatus]